MELLFQRERFTSGLRIANKFKELGEKFGKTSIQVAINWVLAQPAVICALTGPPSNPHLEENIGLQGGLLTAVILMRWMPFSRRLMQV